MWKTVDDSKVRHTYECEGCFNQIHVPPTFSVDSGVPLCMNEDCEDFDTEMAYLNTQIASSEDDKIED